jgi:hypothetical protein
MSWVAVVGLAFVCGFVMDLIWAMCIAAVTQRRPITAANLSALIYL